MIHLCLVQAMESDTLDPILMTMATMKEHPQGATVLVMETLLIGILKTFIMKLSMKLSLTLNSGLQVQVRMTQIRKTILYMNSM